MTNYYDPALESELAYRRDALLHDADSDRLARQARRARPGRAVRRVLPGARSRATVRAA